MKLDTDDGQAICHDEADTGFAIRGLFTTRQEVESLIRQLRAMCEGTFFAVDGKWTGIGLRQ